MKSSDASARTTTPTPCADGGRRGFTLVELMVVLGIGVVLLSIFIPALSSLREGDRRIRCADNLQQIHLALQEYANRNNEHFPRVRYDETVNPDGYAAYTGADASKPFSENSAVKPNDVTASMWLLVRLRLVRHTKFVCPSSHDTRDPLVDASGKPVPLKQRGNFRSPRHLSYSYSSPFSSAPWYRMNDNQPSEFALMADMSPGVAGRGDDVTGPAHDAPPLELARANSNNHHKAGQNVLYAAGYVAFQSTPYCGMKGDNIFTALAPKPLQPGEQPPPTGAGHWGNNIGPAWNADSYLVPTDDEGPR
ncbi:MAG: type II secretion system protein [Tepidisphaeraceae bacterium]